ncbi:MAG: hypothetical protein WCB46_00070 [Methanoregula sp.]
MTGKNHRGVFTFYGTSGDADTRANLSEYMFDSYNRIPDSESPDANFVTKSEKIRNTRHLFSVRAHPGNRNKTGHFPLCKAAAMFLHQRRETPPERGYERLILPLLFNFIRFAQLRTMGEKTNTGMYAIMR